MQMIDDQLLDKISDQAKNSQRLRMNFNLHDSLDSKAQRLLNALEPGTELPIHRHKHTAETYILLKGKIRVLFFNDKKEMTGDFELNPREGKYGIHIPADQWHTVEVLATNSLIFEVKDGPYQPLADADILK